MGGHVTGGWGYVEAAYTLSALALFGYLTSLIFRIRAQARESAVAQAAAAETASQGSLPSQTAGALS